MKTKIATLALSFLFLTVAIFAAENPATETQHLARLEKFPVIPKAREMVYRVLLPQQGLKNPAVIDAMTRVPRVRFVAPVHQAQAYRDTALPIGHAQTISPPYIVAFMTEQLNPKPGDKVLEIGTGSGYQAAVLSLLVDEVYTIEIVEPLGLSAKALLETLGMDNVHVQIGDGYKGWPEAAPFDSIIVTCSPEAVPQPLIDQLREGGLMLIPLGERLQQSFYLCKKVDGKLQRERLTQAFFVPMTGEAEDRRVVKPDPNNPNIQGGDFVELRDDGSPVGWHYARSVTITDEPEAEQYRRFARFSHDMTDGGNSTQKNGQQRFAQLLQGFMADGRKVSRIRITYWMRGKTITPQPGRYKTPTAVLWFYDEQRNQIAEVLMGRSEGTFDWRQMSQDIAVPKRARNAVLMVGLSSASGQLDITDVSVTPIP